jgi:hypothetical protein
MQELGRRVPQQLASAKRQSIGAAGTVDYTVTRSRFRVQTQPNALRLTTQLSGAISTCKPLGPFCVHYGSCNPKWEVAVTLPTDFERELALRPQTSVDMTTGCVLRPVGYDASADLERITRSQTRTARGQIRREINHIEAQVRSRWDQSQQPLALPSGQCLQLAIEQVAYAPPREQDGSLHAAVQASGSIAIGCGGDAKTPPGGSGVAAREGADADLPEVVEARDLEPALDAVVTVPWHNEDLEALIAAELGDSVELAIADRPSRQEPAVGEATHGNALYMTRDTDQACKHWQELVPSLDEGVLTLTPSGRSPLKQTSMPPLSLALPSAALGLQAALEGLAARLGDAVRAAGEEGFTLHVVQATSRTVDVDATGLRIVFRLRGKAAVRAKKAAVASISSSGYTARQ